MIAAEAWWSVIAAYNVRVFPMQVVMYVLAAISAILLFARPGTTASRIVKVYLTFAFAWIGVVFFLVLGKVLPTHNMQAVLFLSIAALLATDLFIDQIEFEIPQTRWHRYVTILLLGATFLYPVLGMLVGHVYPRALILGTFPCPTTAFTLVLMTTMRPRAKRSVHVLILHFLLLLWSIPFPVLIQIPKFGTYEDSIMLATGVFSLVMSVWKWIKQRGLLGSSHASAHT